MIDGINGFVNEISEVLDMPSPKVVIGGKFATRTMLAMAEPNTHGIFEG